MTLLEIAMFETRADPGCWARAAGGEYVHATGMMESRRRVWHFIHREEPFWVSAQIGRLTGSRCSTVRAALEAPLPSMPPEPDWPTWVPPKGKERSGTSKEREALRNAEWSRVFVELRANKAAKERADGDKTGDHNARG